MLIPLTTEYFAYERMLLLILESVKFTSKKGIVDDVTVKSNEG
jgi:hypothetical protein